MEAVVGQASIAAGRASVNPAMTTTRLPRPDNHTVPVATAANFHDVTRPGALWPEAADARCSEQAALFAGSVPAPLTVV